MTDCSDWEDWMDSALFRAMRVLREEDWAYSKEGRDKLYESLARIDALKETLQYYVAS